MPSRDHSVSYFSRWKYMESLRVMSKSDAQNAGIGSSERAPCSRFLAALCLVAPLAVVGCALRPFFSLSCFTSPRFCRSVVHRPRTPHESAAQRTPAACRIEDSASLCIRSDQTRTASSNCPRWREQGAGSDDRPRDAQSEHRAPSVTRSGRAAESATHTHTDRLEQRL